MTAAIKTERLVLRPPEHGDRDRLVALINNWKIASMVGRIPFPYGSCDAEAWLGALAAKPEDRAFALVTEAGLIGGIGLHEEAGRYELGYWVGEPYWGQGYASEAGRALIRVGFETDGIAAIGAAHFNDNPASGRVLQKLGFRYTGESRRPCLARGCDVACREMVLARVDWMKQ